MSARQASLSKASLILNLILVPYTFVTLYFYYPSSLLITCALFAHLLCQLINVIQSLFIESGNPEL